MAGPPARGGMLIDMLDIIWTMDDPKDRAAGRGDFRHQFV